MLEISPKTKVMLLKVIRASKYWLEYLGIAECKQEIVQAVSLILPIVHHVLRDAISYTPKYRTDN